MMQKALKFLGLAAPASACLPCNTMFEGQLSGAEALQIDAIFQKYMEANNSLVDLTEEGRYEIFGNRLIDIVNHNSDETQTFKRGIDRHSAMTFQEVKDYYNMDMINE